MHYQICRIMIVFSFFYHAAALPMNYDGRFITDYDYSEAEPLYLQFFQGKYIIYRIYPQTGSVIDDTLVPKDVIMIRSQESGCSKIRVILTNKEKSHAFIATCKHSIPHEYIEWDVIFNDDMCQCTISQR